MKREPQAARVRPETAPETNSRLLALTEAGLQAEVALYIEQMADELATMANAASLPSLARFLDMARFEAEAIGEGLAKDQA